MFDFPSSPTLGQTFQSGAVTYVWNGYAWSGGQIAQQAANQFFDLSGLTNLDIAVPTWAKHVEITGNIYGASNTNIRISGDGSTFAAGASDYAISGPLHFTGSTAYTVQAQANASALSITWVTDSTTIPQLFTFDMSLSRPTTSQLFGAKCFAKDWNSPAASLATTWHLYGQVNASATTSLTIKALRLYPTSGNFPAGSYLNVKWLGASGQIPISNAIVEAPADGIDYVRQNNVWRPATVQKISGGTTVAAIPSLDVPLPTSGYHSFELLFHFLMPTVAGQSAAWRCSIDGGATYISSASYAQAYLFETHAGGAPTGAGGTGQSAGIVCAGQDSATPGFGKLFIPLHNAAPAVMTDSCAYSGTTYYRLMGMSNCYGVGGNPFSAIRIFYGTGNITTGLKWQLNGNR